MRFNKLNPFELGVKNANEWVEAGKPRSASKNPYREFSEKWALYNKGYNSIIFPALGLAA